MGFGGGEAEAGRGHGHGGAGDAILRHSDYAKRSDFRADVVVVGTGAGGAAVGAELAEAGFDVVFVEEGGYHPTSSFTPYAEETVPRLYRNASSTVILGTPQIPYVEGRCVGGSTVLNGGMTWRAPEEVLADWEKITGSKELGPHGLDRLFDRVEARVHAKFQMPESIGDDNRIMAEGARKLGWKWEVNRRNQDMCVGANNCVFGCPTGAKQSTLVSYVPRALAHGARILTEVKVDRLLDDGHRAVGVRGYAIDPRTRKKTHAVTVHAKAVVVACGAVQTPFLLLKHGLGRPSGQLGKNFLCHPNAKVVAVYPFAVRSWQGVSQWTQVRQFRDEGIVMAENMVAPSALAAHLPFSGARAWEFMQGYDRCVVTGVLVEDSTTGVVRRNPLGMAMARYDITDADHARFVRGVGLLAELHFAMGAESVLLPYANAHVAHSMDEVRAIDTKMVPKHALDLFTVHLMGTTRMGSKRESSVVNLDGELWDMPGCYVADASLFPSAVGVNPQVTIMALATRVGERLAERLARKRGAA
ncbi:MAG: GMC family oxidoreductase [Polyangiaceae bacterium]